ncbi:MAG: HsdR family type I site-specific deoxyribonuclease [Candidatus Gribaldobacteria bacterium]|nr:HsdR family type I site-specific deoxyribonuclease [Candidatus Gribaldobacteria bacterium]
MKFNEQVTIEGYIIKFIKDKLGFEYIKPEEFAGLRGLESEYIITSQLLEAVKRINNVDDEVAQTVVREVKKIDSNQEFLHKLRNGINLKNPATGNFQDYRLLDFEKPENNHFVVTNQFYFEGNAENIRADVMVFVNGLPLVVIEAKSPTASESVSFENGIDQIKRYEKNARRLFIPNCFNIASDGLKTVYGATGASKQYFFQWKDVEIEKEFGGELEMTLFSLLFKENLLDIIQNFILFEKEKEKLVKKIARYQQMRATNKIVARVVTKEKQQGLIWHTQGSGKTLTMFFTAWKLRFNKLLANPKVFILVDRVDLDDQIFETFINAGGKNVERVTSRKDLEDKIQAKASGIFISTMQKFSELGNKVENLDENVIILSDEAHRGNEGVSGINMRHAFKKAFFFGFTGTPVDKTHTNTFRNYEGEGKRYLDYYSIQQAIDDGATIPVTYEARLSKFAIAGDKLDEEFEKISGDLSDKQKTELMKKHARKAALVKLPKRMEAVAKDIVEHYKLYVAPNGFKAQIVAYDREAVAGYKKLLDKLVPAEWSAVVYSPGDPNSDSDDLKVYNTSKREREQVIEKFKDPKSSLRFLLVCDMLLTGFDAPIEQVMYLDKALRDHNLLQAIARTNRVYKNKEAGKIIDYYGITRNLYDALDFDEDVVDSAMIDIERIKERFVNVLNDTMKIFIGVNIEDPSIDNLRRCLKIFIDNQDKQKYFMEKYAKLKSLFEFLSPDPFLKQYIRSFEWVTSFYLAFLKEFQTSQDRYLLEEYGEKVKALIQKSDIIDYEGITKNFRELRVDDLYTLERLKGMDEEQKALNLEKMLKQEISINLDENPAYQKFSERLMAIRQEFEQNQIDLAERIRRYEQLMKDIRTKGNEAKEMGLDLKEYALYVISQEFVEAGKDEAIKEFVKELRVRVEDELDAGWQESSKRDAFIKDVKQNLQELILRDYKDRFSVKDFPKFLNRLVDIITKKF